MLFRSVVLRLVTRLAHSRAAVEPSAPRGQNPLGLRLAIRSTPYRSGQRRGPSVQFEPRPTQQGGPVTCRFP